MTDRILSRINSSRQFQQHAVFILSTLKEPTKICAGPICIQIHISAMLLSGTKTHRYCQGRSHRHNIVQDRFLSEVIIACVSCPDSDRRPGRHTSASLFSPHELKSHVLHESVHDNFPTSMAKTNWPTRFYPGQISYCNGKTPPTNNCPTSEETAHPYIGVAW